MLWVRQDNSSIRFSGEVMPVCPYASRFLSLLMPGCDSTKWATHAIDTESLMEDGDPGSACSGFTGLSSRPPGHQPGVGTAEDRSVRSVSARDALFPAP